MLKQHNSDSEPPGAFASLLGSAIAQAPFAALLFRADDKLTLLWRNAAHEVISQSVGVDVVGQGMFEAFPPNSDEDDGDAAMQAIRNAVSEMCETRQPVDIGPYRYDLQAEDGTFVVHHWRIRMSPVVEGDRVTAVLQVGQDVTQEVLDKALAASMRRAAASTAAVSHFIYDPETDHFDRTADIDEMFGFAPGEAGDVAAPFFERVHPEDLQGVHDEVARVFAAPRGELAAFDYRVPHGDGSERFIRIRAEVAIDPEDRREKLVGTFVDLTDVELDRRQLKRELSLREALVREANHRIKNSLAIALAMLRMERQAIANGDDDRPGAAIAALNELESRIGAISGAHGLMQLEGNRTDVSLHRLLAQLVKQMRATAGLGEDDIRLTCAPGDAVLGSDAATSLALILNEVLTNAIKYGLNTSGNADIEVVAEPDAGGTVIEVRNRIETEAPIDAIPSSKLGSMLVRQLATDFGATVEADSNGCIYCCRIRLPRPEPAMPAA